MLCVPNSPVHRSGKLLCGNFSGTQFVNRGSLGYLPDSQHLEPRSVGERPSCPSPTFMAPILAPGMDFQTFHPMHPIATGYYATPLPTCTSHPPQLAGYCPTVDGRTAADIYNTFMPTFQPFDTPVDFEGMFQDPLVAPQPPTPPAAPETSTPPNPGFHYHPCRWLGGPQCDGFAPGKNREMAEHLRVYHHFIGHERDIVPCEWENCGQSMQRMNVARHIVSRHLLAAASCRFCGKRFSRPDVVARHERSCIGVTSV